MRSVVNEGVSRSLRTGQGDKVEKSQGITLAMREAPEISNRIAPSVGRKFVKSK
jgi:hypothetical protein